MASKGEGELFTRGKVTRDYYSEALQKQEMLTNSRSSSCSSTSSSCSSSTSTITSGIASATSAAALASSQTRRVPGGAPTCDKCGEKWKVTTSLRDVMRDVKKAMREGYIYCAHCNCSAFQRSDIGMGKKVAYCKVCELILCGACCQALLARVK